MRSRPPLEPRGPAAGLRAAQPRPGWPPKRLRHTVSRRSFRMSRFPSLRQLVWGCVLASGLTSAAHVQADATLTRFPTLHGDRVVFEAHGNLWEVSRSGGKAMRLTSEPGYDMM